MNHAVLADLNPEQVEVEIYLAEELAQRRGLTSELDEMWAYVARKSNPGWLWHAIDHHTGKVLAYVFGRRKDNVFLKLKALLEPFGITKYCPPTPSLAAPPAAARPAATRGPRRRLPKHAACKMAFKKSIH